MRYLFSRVLPASALLFCCLLLSFSLPAQDATTRWSLWFGSHYTGLEDYTLRVAEFDRGEDGFMPEFRLNWQRLQGQNRLNVAGHFYDPKRMSLKLGGDFGGLFNGSVAYNSFYRRNQIDLMRNLVAREAGDNQGLTPGGKMLTSELLFDADNSDLGYRRQEITTDLALKIPGMKNIKLLASHRSIIEKGQDQQTQIMHCATCHLQSRKIDLERQSHTVAGGLEAELGKLVLSYQAQYRQFKSDVGTYEAFYDSAQHPVNGSSDDEFASRNIFSGEYVPLNLYPETKKLSHTLKARAKISEGTLLGQFVSYTAENTNDLNDPNVTVSGDRKISGTYGNVKFAYPFFPKTKLIASGYYGRYENDAVDVDLPAWRNGRPAGDIDFDYTRYSSYTRTETRGDLEFLYQPTRRYRLSLLGRYSSKERDDYPFFDAKDKTNTLRLQGDVKYRPTSKFNGHLRYYFENIDNPFAPYNQMFERYGRSGPDSLTPVPGTPAVYYYQRDDIRYGDITSLPSAVNGGTLELTFRPNTKVNLTAGVSGQIGTNSDAPELDYKRTRYQPRLALNLMPSDRLSIFSSYSYLFQTQNGIAAFAMMDG
ncbi:MAG: TonB-dependent receptor [Calditrichae bacterium]|nr:TonB-dependent receptor [Calditrichia bacterium]